MTMEATVDLLQSVEASGRKVDLPNRRDDDHQHFPCGPGSRESIRARTPPGKFLIDLVDLDDDTLSLMFAPASSSLRMD